MTEAAHRHARHTLKMLGETVAQVGTVALTTDEEEELLRDASLGAPTLKTRDYLVKKMVHVVYVSQRPFDMILELILESFKENKDDILEKASKLYDASSKEHRLETYILEQALRVLRFNAKGDAQEERNPIVSSRAWYEFFRFLDQHDVPNGSESLKSLGALLEFQLKKVASSQDYVAVSRSLENNERKKMMLLLSIGMLLWQTLQDKQITQSKAVLKNLLDEKDIETIIEHPSSDPKALILEHLLTKGTQEKFDLPHPFELKLFHGGPLKSFIESAHDVVGDERALVFLYRMILKEKKERSQPTIQILIQSFTEERFNQWMDYVQRLPEKDFPTPEVIEGLKSLRNEKAFTRWALRYQN